jgi:predicted Rossmann-fold nucleotide-binding protein
MEEETHGTEARETGRRAHRQVSDVLMTGGGSGRMEIGGRRTGAWAPGG